MKPQAWSWKPIAAAEEVIGTVDPTLEGAEGDER